MMILESDGQRISRATVRKWVNLYGKPTVAQSICIGLDD